MTGEKTKNDTGKVPVFDAGYTHVGEHTPSTHAV